MQGNEGCDVVLFNIISEKILINKKKKEKITCKRP
jgi:hypothetical protein